jgi:hypothetical protein
MIRSTLEQEQWLPHPIEHGYMAMTAIIDTANFYLLFEDLLAPISVAPRDRVAKSVQLDRH